MNLHGMENVLQNLRTEFAAAGEATERGLYAGGLIIEQDSLRRTPRDTGNLRNSIYTNALPGRKVEVGYTAEYAAAVHENLEAHHNVGEAKFLEHAAQDKEREALEAVVDAIKGAL